MDNAAAPDLLLGANVGNYQVERKLGEGGMGSVYLAVHPKIGKRVALKVLHAEFSSNEDVISRFFNEAKAVNDIGHPNIVDIIDYGTMQAPGMGGQVVYFIMEFLSGDSVAKMIADQAPLAPERAQAIALQVADALGASHRHGIVHRDLKPDNVMLQQRRDGRDFVKVLDFGIAKLTGDTHGSRRTRTGIVMGTPAYMSPEQCEGRGQIDHRTDIYALGILLYEMLTGQVPFRGEGYGEVLVQHMTQVPQKPSTIRGVMNPHLELVCMKALEKRPDNRFPSMDDLMQALTDPVAYVESHGGLEGFLSYGAANPTPYPVLGGAPPYGGGALYTPPPGQLPAIGSAAQTYIPTPAPGTLEAPATGRGKAKIVLAGAGALALGALVLVGVKLMSKSESAPPAAPATTAEKPASATPSAEPQGSSSGSLAPPAAKVKMEIESTPAGAEVFVADVSMGKTPVTFDLDRGDKPIQMVLRAPGHDDRVESVVPNTDRNLELQLTPAKAVEVVKAGSASKGSSSSSKTKSSTSSRRRPTGQKPVSAGDNTLRPNL